MRQPGIFVRFAGIPLVTFLLAAGEALIIYDCYLGQLAWWVGLLAVAALINTLSALKTMRRYNAWHAEWMAMGRTGAPPPPARASPLRQAVMISAGLIGIPLISSFPVMHDNTAVLGVLPWIWGLIALYCIGVGLRALWRRSGKLRRRRQEERADKSLDEPISVVVDRTSGCPTRASIERELPDYCLQLMARD